MDRLHWQLASPEERQSAMNGAERALDQFINECNSIGSKEEMDRHVRNLGTTPTPQGDLLLTKQETWKMDETPKNAFEDLGDSPDAKRGDEVLVAVGGLGWQGGNSYVREPGTIRRVSRDAYLILYPVSPYRLETASVWTHKSLVVDVLEKE